MGNTTGVLTAESFPEAFTGSPSSKRRSGRNGGGSIHNTYTVRQFGNNHVNCAVSVMQGRREYMEDRHLVEMELGTVVAAADDNGVEDHSLFAVFDGHGGSWCSEFLKQNFVPTFLRSPAMIKYRALKKKGPQSRSDVKGIQLLKEAFVHTFQQLDKDFYTESQKVDWKKRQPVNTEKNQEICSSSSSASVELSPAERSGSTAVVVLLTPSHMIAANVGDSRAILRRHGKVYPLSFDHKPHHIPERLRILRAGGTVKNKRVDGELAVSRALGDFTLKQKPIQDDDTKNNTKSDKPKDSFSTRALSKVIAIPEFVVYPRVPTADEFFILACDGVWDVASNDRCSDFVQSLLSEGEVDLGNIAEEALNVCWDRKSGDNMTFILVGLPGLQADRSSRAQFHNALWGYRTSRQAKQITETTYFNTEAAVRTMERSWTNCMQSMNGINVQGTWIAA
jgi:serine/threonine protein phosphatase PrpC